MRLRTIVAILAILAPVLLAVPARAAEPAKPVDVGPKPVPQLVKEILADKAYAFCHDPHYPLTDEEARLCPLITSSDSACPAFIEACKPGPGATRVKPPKQLHFELPDLPGLPRVLLLGLLALAVGGLFYLVLRNVRPWTRRPDDEEAPAEAAPVAAVETALAVETDVERLLASARAAAAAGDHARAIMHLHAALLRRLEGAGLVAVHPSRTNGDYVRAVASARPELVRPVRSFVIDVERAQYGTDGATPELFQSLLSRLPVVPVDKIAALALVALLAFGGGACNGDRGGWEYSPSGRAGVMALLGRAGREVHERLVPVSKLKSGDTDALVLLPDAEVGAEDWAALKPWVETGGTLVLTEEVHGAPEWVGCKWVNTNRSGPIRGSSWFSKQHGQLQVELPASPQLDFDGGHRPLLERHHPPFTVMYAAERPFEKGTIIYMADDRLLTNGALPFGDNARALVLLLADTPRVQLVGELTGFVSPNPVASVVRGRLAPFLVQLMGLAAVFYLFRGVAFGRLREPPAVKRRSFVEHVEALGQQYARARAARHVLSSYGHWVTERLRERVALPAGSGLIALADAVAVRTGKPSGEIMRLLMEARETPPAHVANDPDVQIHLAAVRALGELLSLKSRKDTQ